MLVLLLLSLFLCVVSLLSFNVLWSFAVASACVLVFAVVAVLVFAVVVVVAVAVVVVVAVAVCVSVVVSSSGIVSTGLFGYRGNLKMFSCAYCVAWSSANVSISSDVSPLWIAVPPIASVIVWLVVLCIGLIALIFHPVLLSLFALHAPSEAMNRFTQLSKFLLLLYRRYSYSFILLFSM